MRHFVRIGIDVDQWWRLRSQPDFFNWMDALVPALRSTFEMQALDESLTRWRTTNYFLYPRRPLTEIPTYHKIVHTPPARPEWLVILP